MGYTTTFNMVLRTSDGASDIEDPDIYAKVLELLWRKGIIGYAMDDSLSSINAVNWYNYKEDMVEVSKNVPDVLFCLTGEGDRNGDIWDHYFLNGKSQRCDAEIKIPPFDPGKLE